MNHGSLYGYQQGCREACCTSEKARYRKRWELATHRGQAFLVPTDRLRRKLGALGVLGWSATDVGRLVGVSQQAMSQLLARPTTRTATALKIDEAYRQLEMKVPPDNVWTRRTANRARAQGHHPPLDWEDIDAGILAPRTSKRREARSHDDLDEYLVDQALQYHDFSPRFTRAEKQEIMRRWIRDGRPENALCALTGWREGRYSNTTPTNAQEAS